MKLWFIPWPYDDSEQAGYVIMAATLADALAAGKKYHSAEWSKSPQYRRPRQPQWDKAQEIDGSVYENYGCSE